MAVGDRRRRSSDTLERRYHSAVGSVSGGVRPLVILAVLLAAIAVANLQLSDYVPITILIVPMVLADLVLPPRPLPWFIIATLLIVALLAPVQPNLNARLVVTICVLYFVGLILLLASFRRSRLGVTGIRGESMLVDLRDRILRQGGIPRLPAEWHVVRELRSAGGTSFAGDFVVAARRGNLLHVAVVDVSGKGEEAGTRALLLSGAMGGLIGALPPPEFLPAANDFLLHQNWAEGFATAVHVALDLATGDYEVRSAGHPPAALRLAGSGRWVVLEASGPILGVIEDPDHEPARGRMRSGDALLLYTDGLVESRDRDIMLGVDRMLGQAERLLRGNFENGAARLIDQIGSSHDDRALLLVHRR